MGSDPPGWVRDAVIYQIFPDRFAASDRVHKPGPLEAWDAPATIHGFKGGDLLGIVEHLDHIASLGATTLSLNPIFASAANHRYHTYDYRQVDPLLGGTPALRELVDAVHARGMRIIVDGVFNHAGRGFWPFHHVMENGAGSPYRDWFILNQDWLASGRQLRAYAEPELDPPVAADWPLTHHAGIESLETLGYRAWWDLPPLPKLNTDNPEVREYLMRVAEEWIAFGADGWRLDVAQEIATPGFWQEFRERVRAVDPEAYIVAENWEERPELLLGDTFDALMNYPLLCAAVGYAGGERLDRRVVAQHGWLASRIVPLDGPALAQRLEHLCGLYRPAARDAMLNLIGSHDTPRVRTMTGGDTSGVRLATLLQMTLPGAPSIYYGDEIGLAGEFDPACRNAFPWDTSAWDLDLLRYVTDLVALRRSTPALRSGGIAIAGAAGPAVTYLRGGGAEPDGRAAETTLVALNNAGLPASLAALLPELAGRRFRGVPLGGAPAIAEAHADATGRVDLTLPPRSGLVLRAD